MASTRSLLLAAAVVLCALAASAAAAPPRPAPVQDPCKTNMALVAEGMTNATNTQLALSYGKTNTTSKEKSGSFSVPKWCGPLGVCVGGKQYSFEAGKTKTTTGTSDIVSLWTLNQTSCTNNSGLYTLAGVAGMSLSWFSPITTTTDFYVNGKRKKASRGQLANRPQPNHPT
jgi:hypothetical protein